VGSDKRPEKKKKKRDIIAACEIKQWWRVAESSRCLRS